MTSIFTLDHLLQLLLGRGDRLVGVDDQKDVVAGQRNPDPDFHFPAADRRDRLGEFRRRVPVAPLLRHQIDRVGETVYGYRVAGPELIVTFDLINNIKVVQLAEKSFMHKPGVNFMRQR